MPTLRVRALLFLVIFSSDETTQAARMTAASDGVHAWERSSSSGMHVNVSWGAELSEQMKYTLSLGHGEPWVQSAPVALFASSRWWQASGDRSLLLVGDVLEFHGIDPKLGPYDALMLSWQYGEANSPRLFNTSFKFFANMGAVAFEQLFVDPIQDVGVLEQPPLAGRGCLTGINTTTLPLSEFPSFRAGPDMRLTKLGYTTWAGTCCWRLRVGGGFGLQGFTGGAEGGPLVLFDGNQTASGMKADAIVMSPLDNFMHNIISLRNARTSATGVAPTGKHVVVKLQPDWDNGGHDLIEGSGKAATLQQCEERCRMDTSCAAFTYVDSNATLDRNACFLKSSAARSPVHEHGPAAHHISGVMNRNGSVLAVGVSGQLTRVPAGHISSFVAVGAQSVGVHGALRAWGRAIRSKYSTTRNVNDDIVSNKLGLWTDNGALGSDGDTASLLGSQAQQLLADNVPIRYIQLDPWALDNSAWDARSEYFPAGLDGFRKQAGGLPLLLYGSFWAPKSRGENSTAVRFGLPFVESVSFPYGHGHEQFSEPAPQSAEDFYRSLFHKHDHLIGYENDFLIWDFIATPAFVSEHGALRAWEQLARGMDTAAREKNISLQYCMAQPNQLMQTLELPAVTNARASDDNTPRNRHRWGIGYTALFFNELRVLPFMDNVWTHPNQTCGGGAGHCYSNNRTEAGVALDLAVSALSSGPVGIGDGPGMTDAAAVRRLCALDGTLLHLREPATPIDRMLLKLEMPNSGDGVNGVPEIWIGPSITLDAAPHPANGTSQMQSDIDFSKPIFWSVLVVDATPAGTKLWRSDFFDVAPANTLPLVIANLDSTACANGSLTSDCTVTLGGNPTDIVTLYSKSPKGARSRTDDHSFSVYTAVPSCKGLAFLGEVGKHVAVSPARTRAVLCTDDGLQLQLRPLESFSVINNNAEDMEEKVVLSFASLGGIGMIHHAVVRLGMRPMQLVCSATLCALPDHSCCQIN